MDFVRDQLFDGRRFRVSPLVDNYSRESRQTEVEQNRKGIDVVMVMERIKAGHRVIAKRIHVGYGSEFISKASDKLAHETK